MTHDGDSHGEGSVISCVCEVVSLSVCVCLSVHTAKGKRLELSMFVKNIVHSRLLARIESEVIKSKGKVYEVQTMCLVIGKPCMRLYVDTTAYFSSLQVCCFGGIHCIHCHKSTC